MTNNNHPITPPPELQAQWRKEWSSVRPSVTTIDQWIATKSAQWGYAQRGAINEVELQKARDEELEAIIDWMTKMGFWSGVGEAIPALRAARRPSPPSLKEQALQALANADGADHPVVATVLTADQHALIRKALEQLND